MANEQLTRFLLKTIEVITYGMITVELTKQPAFRRMIERGIQQIRQDSRGENVVDLAVWRERRGK